MGLRRLCDGSRRAHAPKPPRYLRRQHSPAIFCLNKDPTSSKEITYGEAWADIREGSQGDFFLVLHSQIWKEIISGKGCYSQWNGKDCGFPLSMPVRAGPRVHLAVSQRLPSPLDTEWPWSVLLFSNRAQEVSSEVTYRGSKWHDPSCAVGGTETQHPTLIHRFKTSHEMHLKSDPKFFEMTLFTKFSGISHRL